MGYARSTLRRSGTDRAQQLHPPRQGIGSAGLGTKMAGDSQECFDTRTGCLIIHALTQSDIVVDFARWVRKRFSSVALQHLKLISTPAPIFDSVGALEPSCHCGSLARPLSALIAHLPYSDGYKPHRQPRRRRATPETQRTQIRTFARQRSTTPRAIKAETAVPVEISAISPSCSGNDLAERRGAKPAERKRGALCAANTTNICRHCKGPRLLRDAHSQARVPALRPLLCLSVQVFSDSILPSAHRNAGRS